MKKGATFHFDADVIRLKTLAGGGVSVAWNKPGRARDGGGAERFDGIVVCAGVASRRFARDLGDRVNIYPVKGYSITVNLDDQASRDGAPWVSLLDDHAKVVTSRLGEGRLRVAGTAEFAGENRDIKAARIRAAGRLGSRALPDISTDNVVPWAGLRPMMPNMMPRVGAGRNPAVFYNTGHGHLGWTLSAVTADMVAGAVAGRFGAGKIVPVSTGAAREKLDADRADAAIAA